MQRLLFVVLDTGFVHHERIIGPSKFVANLVKRRIS